MTDTPASGIDGNALPTHIESYGQPWAPSVDGDPAYKPAENRITREIDLGHALVSVTYLD